MLLRYSIFIILRLSSIGGCVHHKQLSILVWSYLLMFQIWGRYDKWLLRYFTFNILRSISIGVHQHCKVWSGHLSLSFKFGYVLIRGCWCIPLLIFWGRLPMDVVFFFLLLQTIWYCPRKLSFKFCQDQSWGCWVTIHFHDGWVGGLVKQYRQVSQKRLVLQFMLPNNWILDEVFPSITGNDWMRSQIKEPLEYFSCQI
jgi:hypothetical protein